MPSSLHDDGFVAHRGNVGAAGGARSHHGGDLRNALARHARLIVEDAPEVIAIGKHVGLQRQKRAAGIDEVDARQVILLGDLLRAQMLLHRHRIVRAALDGGVVGDDRAVLSLHEADTGDDPGDGESPPYMSKAASAENSRKPEPGSIKRSMRSRAVSLLRRRCFSTASGPPPSRTAISRSRSSATRRSIRRAFAAKSSEFRSRRDSNSAIAAAIRHARLRARLDVEKSRGPLPAGLVARSK